MTDYTYLLLAFLGVILLVGWVGIHQLTANKKK